MGRCTRKGKNGGGKKEKKDSKGSRFWGTPEKGVLRGRGEGGKNPPQKKKKEVFGMGKKKRNFGKKGGSDKLL